MRVAVFTTSYGLCGAGAAGIRWYWLAYHLANASADVTIFHGTESARGINDSHAKQVYLPEDCNNTRTLLRRGVNKLGCSLGSQQYWGSLNTVGHYLSSAALLYGETAWEGRAIHFFEEVHRRTPFDCVIGVCAPWAPAAAAYQVATKWKLPYYIEFQDPWKSFFDKGAWRIHLKTIKEICGNSEATINVCEQWCEEDGLTIGRPTLCVPNGYESSQMLPSQTSPDLPLRIAYVGTMGYFGKETLQILWRGLGDAASTDWVFDYIGSDFKSVQDEVDKNRFMNNFNVSAVAPQSEALKTMFTADVLVMFQHPSRKGHFGSKFAEYIASQRPILLLGKRDNVVVAEASRLTRVISCETASDLSKAIQSLIGEKKRTGQLWWQGNEESIGRLSWSQIAKELLAEIERCLHDQPAMRTALA